MEALQAEGAAGLRTRGRRAVASLGSERGLGGCSSESAAWVDKMRSGRRWVGVYVKLYICI